MPQTPDRFHGPQYEEGIYLEDVAFDPSEVGEIRRNGSNLLAYDGSGLFNLRAAGFLTEAAHKTLRHLIHFVDDGPAEGFTSGAYKETLPAGNPFPTSEIWWASSDKLLKIVELLVTRDSGKKPTTEVWKIYDAAGSLIATVTDSITYSGIFETTRTRTVA